VRQPYGDSDVGRSKALVLADRLNTITGKRPVAAVADSVQNLFRNGLEAAGSFDLIIDATADAAVASLLELHHAQNRFSWPATLAVVIGQSARRGVVCVAQCGATGLGRDIMRRLALDSRGRHATRLADVASEIFPAESPAQRFLPEPGCSAPTFVGSATELAGLAGALLDAGLCARQARCPDAPTEPMSAGVVRLGTSSGTVMLPGVDWFGWPNDALSIDAAGRYEVRIAAAALSTMRAECRRGLRLRGPRVETGGALFGRIDDACRCVWVDLASGPPPDSHLHETYFEHGTEGLEALIAHHRRRSGTLTAYLGMWHAHPLGDAAPSERDIASLAALVGADVGGPPRALLLILGGRARRWNEWLNDREHPDFYAEMVSRARVTAADYRNSDAIRIAEHDWPGGWRMPATSRPRNATGLVTTLLRRILSQQ
jgi:integrative and conjugative element protein (TIGR02256 family)